MLACRYARCSGHRTKHGRKICLADRVGIDALAALVAELHADHLVLQLT